MLLLAVLLPVCAAVIITSRAQLPSFSRVLTVSFTSELGEAIALSWLRHDEHPAPACCLYAGPMSALYTRYLNHTSTHEDERTTDNADGTATVDFKLQLQNGAEAPVRYTVQAVWQPKSQEEAEFQLVSMAIINVACHQKAAEYPACLV